MTLLSSYENLEFAPWFQLDPETEKTHQGSTWESDGKEIVEDNLFVRFTIG
jgi:hypothetical protein